MALVANDPAASKRLGIPQKVGKDFMEADKGRKFARGGEMKESKKMIGKEIAFMKKKGAPKSMIKHEKSEMMGMKHGGEAKKYAFGGSLGKALRGVGPAVQQAASKVAQTVQSPPQPQPQASAAPKRGGILGRFRGRFEEGGKVKGYASGGLTSGHKAADGIAKKGKTKGTQVKMMGGGKC